MEKNSSKWIDGIIALALGLLTAIVLVATSPSTGFTTDEPNYINADESYGRWLSILVKDPARAFSSQTINTFLASVHEHPPVEKYWAGMLWLVGRHFFDPLTAHRLGPILLVAIMVGLLYLLVAKEFGRAAGLFAAAALLSMPRFFFHAHLAALDVPVAFGAFAVTFLFWKTIERRNWWWGIVLGAAWGLAEGIKLNATFIPISLVLWSLLYHRKGYVAIRFLLMGLVAVLSFLLIWPWLYFNTWTRLLEYINFHVNHYGIGAWYLGQAYLPPPWHYVFVTLWAVLPLTLILMIAAGVAGAGKKRKGTSLVWLLVLSVFAAIFPFIFGVSLAYNGERLFMPAFPFLAALAGIGFGRLVAWLRQWMQSSRPAVLTGSATALLGLALLTPQTVTMARLYPHLLSYYSESVGGLRGATKLGLETTYWSEAYISAIPYLNAHARPGDIVWTENGETFEYYQRFGWLRSDIKFMAIRSPEDPQYQPGTDYLKKASWFVYVYQQSKFGFEGEDAYPPWTLLRSQSPVFVVSFEGVPIMSIYGKVK